MAVDAKPHVDAPSPGAHTHEREVIACESAPERIVLIESGNSDGWIASDLSVEPVR